MAEKEEKKKKSAAKKAVAKKEAPKKSTFAKATVDKEAVKKKVVKKEAQTEEAKAPETQAVAAAPIHAPAPAHPVHREVKKHKAPKAVKHAVKFYGTGRRKTSTARVWLFPGSGKITVNDRDFLEYFNNRRLLELMITLPLAVHNAQAAYDVMAKVAGGGVASQAGAVGMGIARAMLMADAGSKPDLRRGGFLTRDPRMKERKKYGHKRARKSFQFSKR